MSSFIIGFSVNHYVDHKLDVKYLRDPDGGINVLKKKAEEDLLDQTAPTEIKSFPTKDTAQIYPKCQRLQFGNS